MWNAAAEEWTIVSRSTALQPFINPAGTVFEYGAQNGWNLSRLKARRKLLCPRAGAVGFQDNGVELVEGPDAVEVGSMDAILCYHVLEYLLEPVTAIDNLKKLLKPGGRLVIFAVYDRAFHRPRLTTKATHFYSWNVQTLGNLLIDCGFVFESGTVRRCANEYSVCHWANKFQNRRWVFGLAARLSRILSPELEVRVSGKWRG